MTIGALPNTTPLSKLNYVWAIGLLFVWFNTSGDEFEAKLSLAELLFELSPTNFLLLSMNLRLF